eukprot:15454115-Alexandrium_andersonii.AAC.1
MVRGAFQCSPQVPNAASSVLTVFPAVSSTPRQCLNRFQRLPIGVKQCPRMSSGMCPKYFYD